MDNSFLHRKKLLLVDDEPELLKMVSDILKDAGFEIVLTAATVKEAVMVAKQEKPDLMILDVMLPELNGFELMEYIRPMGIPVIFLTAKDSLKDRMQGLTSGAEDYMVKPFEVVELLARINIVLRRYHKMEQKITFMDIELDSENQVVTKAGKEVELTPKEFELLEILMRNRNITLFRERIYEEIWGTEYSVESRTLDLHIQRLRKKLNLGAELKTVFKAGYRLEDKA